MNKAFTLVELIVVITILAILATVGFISFQGYTTNSRDGVRLADLQTITKSLELLKSKGEMLPLPENSIQIINSGSILQYQGELSEDILKKDLGIFDGGLDPSTQLPYIFTVNNSKNKYQILGFLEKYNALNGPTLNSLYANDDILNSKILKGDKLGIIYNANTFDSIHLDNTNFNIDFINNDYILFLDNNSIPFIGGKNLFVAKYDYKLNKTGSCYSILMNGLSTGNGLYSINPNGGNEYIDVYCDMITDGGGWTLLATAIGEDTSIYNYDDIVNWNSSNSHNCGIDTECLSQSGELLNKWDELLIYTRGYKVKGVACNDIGKSIYDYSQLDYPVRISTTNWPLAGYGAIGKCDEEYEVSQGLVVSDKTANNDKRWTTRMGVKSTGNEVGEHSLLFFGPTFMPIGLGNARFSDTTGKINNHYTSDMSFQQNRWDGASTEKQVWFIR